MRRDVARRHRGSRRGACWRARVAVSRWRCTLCTVVRLDRRDDVIAVEVAGIELPPAAQRIERHAARIDDAHAAAGSAGIRSTARGRRFSLRGHERQRRRVRLRSLRRCEEGRALRSVGVVDQRGERGGREKFVPVVRANRNPLQHVL